MMGEKKFLFSRKDILGGLAKWAVRQSPYHRPDNLEIVLDKLHEVLPQIGGSMFYEKTYGEIKIFLSDHLLKIPELTAWNERKNGNQCPFGFSSRYDHPIPDNDFIALDALIRNIANDILRESVECSIPAILGEPENELKQTPICNKCNRPIGVGEVNSICQCSERKANGDWAEKENALRVRVYATNQAIPIGSKYLFSSGVVDNPRHYFLVSECSG